MSDNIIFNFVTEWIQQNKDIAPPDLFKLKDVDYEAFKEFVKSSNFEYDKLSELYLQQLKSIMEFEGYMGVASEEFKALEAKLHPNLDRDLELFKDLIKSLIETEIVQRAYYKKGVLIHQLANDDVFDKAIEVLKNPDKYKALLQPSSK